ncbi:MAG TPA: formimidoylglutamate deiminase [Aestuariivirga sp.]|nr:formimidoylglutamate deiminase [Aestuariivirga sp.]
MTQGKFRFTSALTSSGWQKNVAVAVDQNGMIESVAADAKDGALIPGIAIPAVPNVHSHAHQRLMVGLAERAGPGADSFWTWREAMYGFALKLSPDDLEAVAAQAYVEMVKAGFSCVGEFQYLHHKPDGSAYDEPAEMSLRCISAADEAGIAITMLPTLYNYAGFGGQAPTAGQRRFVNGADRYLEIYETLKAVCGASPLRRIGISPHSLRAVTPELLKTVLDGIDDDARVHIHVAEQSKEVDDCLAWCGKRPVEFLLDQFDVSGRWCTIHATHMTADETQRLAKSRAIAGLCPTTEANLGDGIFTADSFIKLGGAIAIGSDSQITISPAEDLRMLEYSQRLRDRTRNALASGAGASTGRCLLDAVLKGGAACLDNPMGAIAAGKRCDIAVLDRELSAMTGREEDAALDTWIFSAGNAAVKDVIVGGSHVVKDRRHIHEDRIQKRFRETVRRMS